MGWGGGEGGVGGLEGGGGISPLIRNFRAKFGIPSLLQSPDIWQNSDGCISEFLVITYKKKLS